MSKMNEQSFRQAIAGRARTGVSRKFEQQVENLPRTRCKRISFLQEQARSWLQQFHAKNKCGAAFSARWTEVRSQIRNSGAYSLNTEELAYGAKVAWRNSTRCVGRLGWDSLTVRDCRQAPRTRYSVRPQLVERSGPDRAKRRSPLVF